MQRCKLFTQILLGSQRIEMLIRCTHRQEIAGGNVFDGVVVGFVAHIRQAAIANALVGVIVHNATVVNLIEDAHIKQAFAARSLGILQILCQHLQL